MIRLDGLIGLGCLGKIGPVGLFVQNLREKLWREGLDGLDWIGLDRIG
jgi:hypothetical protein